MNVSDCLLAEGGAGNGADCIMSRGFPTGLIDCLICWSDFLNGVGAQANRAKEVSVIKILDNVFIANFVVILNKE